MAAILAFFGSISAWFIAQVAARLGIRLGLISLVVACFTAIYGLMVLALLAIVALIPAAVLPPALTQFFPDSTAIAFAFSAYWGSMITKKSWDYWRMALGVAVQVSS